MQVPASRKASASGEAGPGLQQPQTPQQQPPATRSPNRKELSPLRAGLGSPTAGQHTHVAGRAALHHRTQPPRSEKTPLRLNGMTPTAAVFQPSEAPAAAVQQPVMPAAPPAAARAGPAGSARVASSAAAVTEAGPGTGSVPMAPSRGYYPPVEMSFPTPQSTSPAQPHQQAQPHPTYAPHSYVACHAQRLQLGGPPRPAVASAGHAASVSKQHMQRSATARPAAGPGKPSYSAQRPQPKYTPLSPAQQPQPQPQQQQQHLQQQQRKPLYEAHPQQQPWQQPLLSEEEAVAQALRLSTGQQLAWQCAACTYRHEGAEANYLSCAICTASKPAI